MDTAATTIARRSLLGLGAGLGAGALSSCFAGGPPKQAPPADGERVPIEVWSGWTENAAKQIESILDDFNSRQSAVTAKHVVVPDDMSQKLLAGVTAGNPPATAIVFGAGTAYQLSARNALAPVEDLASADELAAAQEWMTPGLWELGRFNDKMVFVPMWAQAWGVFVNTKIARAAGVDPDTPPKDLDELAAAWVEMTKRDSRGEISVLGGILDEHMLTIARFLGNLTSEDGATITTDAPEVVEALSWADAHRDQLGRKAVQRFQAGLQGRSDRSGAQDPFLGGLTATLVTGSWEFDTVLKYAPKDFEYTVWPLPKPAGVTQHGTYTYGDGFIFPRTAAEVAAGWQVARQMTGLAGDVDLYSKLFTTWQCVNAPISEEVPKLTTFRDEVSSQCPGYEDVFLADLFEADRLLYPPKIATSSSYLSQLQAMVEKINLGEVGVAEGLASVRSDAQRDLDTWKEQNS